MPRVFLAILLLAFSGGARAQAASPSASALQQAAGAYFQMQVPEAEALYRSVLDDPAAAPAEVASAGRGLARIQWRVDADAPAAEATLRRALAAGADLCPTATYAVRVRREAGDPRGAAALAAAHAADCPGAALGDGLRLQRARAELAWADSDPARRAQALGALRATLAAMSSAGRMGPDAARVRLQLALETGDASAALEAWRAFFWLTDHEAPDSFHIADAQVRAVFTRGVRPRAAVADAVALERLLIRAGFYEEAQRFDALRGLAARAGGDPAYRPVATYFALRLRLDAATLAFNRAQARGKGQGEAYQAEAIKALLEAAVALGPGAPVSLLRDAYGLQWTIGLTGGVTSLHMGHVVDDRRYQVDQFGRHADLPFVSIDNLVSNGFQSWLWDGMAATGGWSEGAAIVQIRAAYTPTVLKALAAFDPEVARRDAAELVKLEARDREALAAKPVVFLPGLARRLSDQARAQVADVARATGAQAGEAFDRAFLKLYWEALIGHSIYIHEGRHALDHIQFTGAAALSSAELEYRAKLSELELAAYPRMALFNILAADIGDKTSHGIADTRVMQGLVDWISAHRGEVAGYDPAVPAAEQIDKLSDAQLRAIARALDPRFKEPGAPGPGAA